MRRHGQDGGSAGLRSAAGALGCALVIALTGCVERDVERDVERHADADGAVRWTIGMSQANLAEPYRVQMDADIRRAAEAHPEIRVQFKDAQKDSLRQRGHVEEYVTARVDLLLISPNEPQPLARPVADAMDAGIPVIVLDRRISGDAYTSFVGADNYRIGRAAGNWIVDRLGGSGRVVELQGMMTTDPAQQRHRGFMDAIEGTDIEVIFRADMRWDQSQAMSEMESALARFDEIDLVYAHNDPGAYGAYLAARAAGREDDILFVGIDALPQEGVAYVRQGILDVSFEYPTGGREAVDLALRVLRGEDVPREIVLESRYFTPDNVEDGGAPVQID